jgi:hypothetical protein
MKLARLFGRGQQLTSFLDRFMANDMPSVLAQIGRPSVVTIEPFPHGHSGLVRRLFLADGRSLVLRAYFVDPVKRKGFARRHLIEYLAAAGFHVPAIHFSGIFPFPRGLADVDLMIEEFVDGQPIADAVCNDQAGRRHLAEILWKIHGDRSPRPGRTWLEGPNADPLRAALAKAPELLDRVRRQWPDIPPPQIKSSLTWLRETITGQPVPESYELIHGDFHRNNFKMTPDGEIVMIDLGAMTYGYFEADLVDARWGFIDQAWWEGFCADYFAVNPAGRERFERYAPLFFALFYLTKASVRAVRARKSLEKNHSETAEIHRAKGRRYWNLLLAAMESEPLRRDLLFEIEDD